MKTIRQPAAAVLFAAPLIALGGCGTGPPPGQPLTPTLVGSLTTAWGADHLAFSPDGRTLAVNNGKRATDDGSGALVLWEVASLGRRRQDHLPGGYVDLWKRFAYTPDGRRLAVQANRDVLLWDLVRRRVTRRFTRPGEVENISDFVVSPDGLTLAFVRYQAVALWDYERGVALGELTEGKEDFAHAAFSGDGKVLATTGTTPRLWDVATRRPGAALEKSAGYERVAFSPCGRWLATANLTTHGLPVQVRDARTGEVRDTCPLPAGDCKALSFSADGRLLAVGDEASGAPLFPQPGRVRLWDTESRREVAGVEGLPEGILHLAFSPVEPLLAVAYGPRERPGNRPEFVVRLYRVGPPTPDAEAAPAKPFEAPAEALPPEATAWWDALAGDDAERAYDAVLALGGKPAVAVALLGQKLRPVAAPDPRRFEALAADLGSDDFATRDRASRELAALGEQAEPALRRAAASSNAEVRRRSRDLLAALEPPLRDGERLRAVRAAEALEMAGGADARRLLAWLATGAPGATLTREASASLRRLDRAAPGRR